MIVTRINRESGIVVSADIAGVGTVPRANSAKWKEILDWNAKQPTPLDLSDQPPEPPPMDAEAEQVKALVLADGNYTLAEATKVLNFLAKRHLGIR